MHHGTTPMSYASVSQNESPNNPFGFSVSSPNMSISHAKVKFFPRSKTDAVFRFQWPCCLSPWDWWASWAFEALGHWSWRCVNLMMFRVFLVLSHAYPRMISTVSIKQFVGSAFHFNLETRSVTCHTSGHLHFHTTLRYDQILEAVHCGGFPPLLQEKHQWSCRVKPWIWSGVRVELDGENNGEIKSWKQLKFIKRFLKQSLSNQSIPNNRTF